MHVHRSLVVALATLLTLCLAGPPAAQAAPAGPLWTNDSPLTKVVAKHFSMEPITVVTVAQNMKEPLDALVTMFVARQVEAKPLDVFKRRQAGQHWAVVFNEMKVDPTFLFDGLDPRAVPVNLRHAWRERATRPVVFYDNEVRELAGLRFVVEVLHLSPAEALSRHKAGEGYIDMVLDAEALPKKP